MSAISLFEEKQVRRAWNAAEEKWVFAIVDVIAILTDSIDPSAYWRKLKERLKKEGIELVTFCHGLKMTAAAGKQRLTDVADTEQLLRLIQSVPSPKAEPFKRWLAKVGYERLEEIEKPELAARRTRTIYEQKGYSEEWIEKRLRGIAVRDELTDEWKNRGVKEGRKFAILTAEISKAKNSSFPPTSFSATLIPQQFVEYSSCKPSIIAAFRCQIHSSPHWQAARLWRSGRIPKLLPSSFPLPPKESPAPVASPRVNSLFRQTSTLQTRKSRPSSTASPEPPPLPSRTAKYRAKSHVRVATSGWPRPFGPAAITHAHSRR